MTAYDLWLEPPDLDDDEPEVHFDDVEPDGLPFEPGDWRSDERCIQLERRYAQ